MKNDQGWRNRSVGELLTALSSDAERGLDRRRAVERLRRYGKNDLWYTGGPFMFIRSESILSLVGYAVMAVASFSAAAFDKCADSVPIGVFLALGLVFSAALYISAGIVCRHCCKRWIPTLTVIRDGKPHSVRGDRLTVGDVVLLHEGDTVCADMKLIASDLLSVAEPSASGKPRTVGKGVRSTLPTADDAVVPEDFLYAGSEVLGGTARALVTAVGAQTRVGAKGKISLTSAREPSALTAYRKLGVRLGTGAMIFAFAAILVGIFVPLAATDFIGLFLVLFSYAITVGGEILPSLYCFAATVALVRSKESGVTLRDVSAADRIVGCDGIAVESTSLMKSGEVALRTVWASGRVVDTDSGEADDLFSLLITGTDSGKGKYGKEILGAVSDHLKGKGDAERFITATETMKPVLEHRASGGTHYSLFTFGGEHYFALTGAIDEVLEKCTRLRIDGDEITMTREQLSNLLGAASEATKSASVLVAVAVKKSPYNSLKRLSVLSDRLTFVGFVAVDTPPSPELAGDLAYLKQNGIPFVFFTDGAGDDINFARRIGIIRDRDDVASKTDGAGAFGALVAEKRSGAVLADGDEIIHDALLAAKTAGHRVVYVGDCEKLRGCGFSVSVGAPCACSGAAVDLSASGETAAVLGVYRTVKKLSSRFTVAKRYLLISSVLRGIYAVSVIFGLAYVYPSVILGWGLAADLIAAVGTIGLLRKKK